LGQKPLVAKSRASVGHVADRLRALRKLIPISLDEQPSHDELQALIAGLAGLPLLCTANEQATKWLVSEEIDRITFGRHLPSRPHEAGISPTVSPSRGWHSLRVPAGTGVSGPKKTGAPALQSDFTAWRLWNRICRMLSRAVATLMDWDSSSEILVCPRSRPIDVCATSKDQRSATAVTPGGVGVDYSMRFWLSAPS